MISYHTCPLASEEGKETGGMNVYVLELAKELGKLGHTVDIITRIQDSSINVVQIAERVRLIHLAAGPAHHVNKKKLLTFIPEFVQSFLELRTRENLVYDIIDAHYYQSGLIGSEIAKYFPNHPPLVMTFHTLALMKNLVARDLSEQESNERLDAEFFLAEKADAIITPSWSDGQYLHALYNAPSEKMHEIPPGVNVDIFKPKNKDAARDAIGAKHDAKIVLFVGRIEPLKGIDMIMYALKIFISRHPEVPICFMIVGGDISQHVSNWSPIMRQLEELRHRLQLTAQVKFVGQMQQSQLVEYYNAAELVIMPSHYESFGMAAAESMSCGTPVITTNASGISYLIDEKKTSLITSVNNPLLLASQIEKLLLDEDAYRQASRDAVEYVDDLRWSISAQKVSEVFEGLGEGRV